MTPIDRRAAIAALASLSVGALTRRPASAQSTREQIRVGGAIAEDLTSLYYGIKRGVFDRAGLDIQIVATNSGSAATAAVVAGSLEMAKTSLLSVFNAHLRGIPVSIVAPEVLYGPHDHEGLLQVATASPYKTAADLNGKTIGTPSLGDLNTLVTKAWIDKNGGDSKSLKFVEIANSAQPAALDQHRIDAAIIESPALDISLADGSSRTLADPMVAIGSSYMIAAFIVKTDWATQHVDALRRFTKALFESARYVNAHRPETAPLLAELTKIDLATAQKMNRTLAGTSLDVALIQPYIDAAAKYELIPRSFSAKEILWSPDPGRGG